jgi:hypothetical protein
VEREELEGNPERNFVLGRCIDAHVLLQRRVFAQNLLLSVVMITTYDMLDRTKK